MNSNNKEVRKVIDQATLDELHVLIQRFPMVIIGMNALESEFLEYQATPDDEFSSYFDEDDRPMRIDLYRGHPRFKHLTEFAKFLLLIPHSNSYCEGLSMVQQILQKHSGLEKTIATTSSS